MSVCLSVCYVKNRVLKLHRIFCTLLVAVNRISADGNAIEYTLCISVFVDDVMFSI